MYILVCVCMCVCTTGHTGFLTDSGRAYMCGRNARGQLGLGNISNFSVNERGHPYQPTFMPLDAMQKKKIISMACGGEHSVFICEHDEVYAAGTGHKGQLGIGQMNGINDQVTPVILQSLKSSGM